MNPRLRRQTSCEPVGHTSDLRPEDRVLCERAQPAVAAAEHPHNTTYCSCPPKKPPKQEIKPTFPLPKQMSIIPALSAATVVGTGRDVLITSKQLE